MEKSARGICSSNPAAKEHTASAIRLLTQGYDSVHEQQEREYFGLRDFYSVVKMVFAVAIEKGREPTPAEIQFAVQRNFGGYFGDFDPAEEFLKAMGEELRRQERTSPKDLITDAISANKGDSRYFFRSFFKKNSGHNVLFISDTFSS